MINTIKEIDRLTALVTSSIKQLTEHPVMLRYSNEAVAFVLDKYVDDDDDDDDDGVKLVHIL